MNQSLVTEAGNRPGWIRKVNMLLLLTLIMYLGYSLTISSIVVATGGDVPILGNTMFQLVSQQIILLAPSVVFFWKHKVPVLEYLHIKPLRIPTVLLVIVFTYVSYPIISLCNYISLFFTKNVIDNTMEELLGQYPTVVCVIAVAFVPCVVEELIFRGVLYRTYKQCGVGKAILLTAFLFGLFHMNLNQMSYAVVMGIVLVLLNEATGSMISSMLMHFFINATSVVSAAAYYKQYGTLQSESQNGDVSVLQQLIVLSIGSLIFMALLLRAMTKLEKRKWVMTILKQRKEKVKELQYITANKEKIFSGSLLVVIVICIAMVTISQLA